MFGGEEFGHHDHGDGDLAAKAEAHHEASCRKDGVIRRHGAQQRTAGEDDQVDDQHLPAAVLVHDQAGGQASKGRGGERHGVQQADLGGSEPPGLAQHRAGDAHGVLFEGVEEDAEKNHEDDLAVGARDTDPLVRVFDLFGQGSGPRSGCLPGKLFIHSALLTEL